MATTDGFSEVMAAIRGQRTRSPLYRWLSDNYAQIAAVKAGGGNSDWVRTALELNKLGIRTADGTKLKGETVRRTWWRVRRDMQIASDAHMTKTMAPQPTNKPALRIEHGPDGPPEFGFRVLNKGK